MHSYLGGLVETLQYSATPERVHAPLPCFDICFYGSEKSILLEENTNTRRKVN